MPSSKIDAPQHPKYPRRLAAMRTVWMGFTSMALIYAPLVAFFVGFDPALGLDPAWLIPLQEETRGAVPILWMLGVAAPIVAVISRGLSWGRSAEERSARRRDRSSRRDARALDEPAIEALIGASFQGWILRVSLAELGSVFGLIAAILSDRFEPLLIPMLAHLVAALLYYPSRERILSELGFRADRLRTTR